MAVGEEALSSKSLTASFFTAEEGSTCTPPLSFGKGSAKGVGKGKGKRQQREEDIRRLFAVIARQAARAGEAELLRFAELCGFDGGAAVWADEYRVLAEMYGWEPVKGIDASQFIEFVNDKNSSGYCTCAELRSLLQELGVFSSLEKENEELRVKRIHGLFQILDKSGKGRLGEGEMFAYAELCGFRGTRAEWAQEFGATCQRNMWDHSLGLDAAQFAHCVNGLGSGAFVSTVELRDLLECLQTRDHG